MSLVLPVFCDSADFLDQFDAIIDFAHEPFALGLLSQDGPTTYSSATPAQTHGALVDGGDNDSDSLDCSLTPSELAALAQILGQTTDSIHHGGSLSVDASPSSYAGVDLNRLDTSPDLEVR